MCNDGDVLNGKTRSEAGTVISDDADYAWCNSIQSAGSPKETSFETAE